MNVPHHPPRWDKEHQPVTIHTQDGTVHITNDPDIVPGTIFRHVSLGGFMAIRINQVAIAGYDPIVKQAIQEHFDPACPEMHDDVVAKHLPYAVGFVAAQAAQAAHDQLDPEKTPDVSFLLLHFQLSRASK